MNKTYLVSVVSLICLLGSADFASAVELRVATAAPEASDWVQAMREGAAEIKKQTEGRVTITYYVGGIQGSDTQVLRKVQLGSLQGAAFTAGAFNEVYPDINIYSLPGIFDSYDEADWVREHMDDRLIQGVNGSGFVTFGFASTGFAVVMSKDPVASVADLANKKVWVPEGDKVSYSALEALGVKPTPLPLTDVMMGLQTNLLDIITVSPVGAVFLQWVARINYVTDIPLVYTFGFLVIDQRAFDRIEPRDQAIVRDVMSEMYTRFDKRGETDNANAYQAILNDGVKEVTPKPEEVARIRETLATSNQEMAKEGIVTEATYDLLLQCRNVFRHPDARSQAQQQIQAASDLLAKLGASISDEDSGALSSAVQQVEKGLDDCAVQDILDKSRALEETSDALASKYADDQSVAGNAVGQVTVSESF